MSAKPDIDLIFRSVCDHHRAETEIDALGRLILWCPCGHSEVVQRRMATQDDQPEHRAKLFILVNHDHLPLCSDCGLKHVARQTSVRCRDCSHARRVARDNARHKKSSLNWNHP